MTAAVRARLLATVVAVGAYTSSCCCDPTGITYLPLLCCLAPFIGQQPPRATLLDAEARAVAAHAAELPVRAHAPSSGQRF